MEVVEYNITDAAISEMESLYMGLTISNLGDKKEFKAVHDARMVVKGKRVEVEKKRKELKADALAWGKKVDTEAKRIFGLLEPIETHLMAEENKVFEEQKRIKAEEEEKQRKIIQGRVDELLNIECVMPFMEVATLSDEEYTDLLMGKTLEYEAAQAKKADEEAARKAEAERLAKQKAEQEAEADKLKKAQDALEAEKKAVQKEKDRLEKEAFEKQALENARIQAEADAKAKIEREAKKAIKAAEEAKRAEALKPDKEKINYWLEQIENALDASPEVEDKNAVEFVSRVIGDVGGFLINLKGQIEVL